MKYIHVPTGLFYDEPHLSKLDINDFVLSELPKYWRVEGYRKSWEWANALSETKDNKEWDWVSNKLLRSKEIANAFFEGNILQKQTQVISRAAFEYHIYNPWKGKRSDTTDVQDALSKEPHYNHQPIEVIDMMLSIYGKEAVIHFCLLNSFKYRMRAGHKDDAVKDIEKAVWYEKKAKELEIK